MPSKSRRDRARSLGCQPALSRGVLSVWAFPRRVRGRLCQRVPRAGGSSSARDPLVGLRRVRSSTASTAPLAPVVRPRRGACRRQSARPTGLAAARRRAQLLRAGARTVARRRAHRRRANPGDASHWISRRDPLSGCHAPTLFADRNGVPYLAPELVLLSKSRRTSPPTYTGADRNDRAAVAAHEPHVRSAIATQRLRETPWRRPAPARSQLGPPRRPAPARRPARDRHP